MYRKNNITTLLRSTLQLQPLTICIFVHPSNFLKYNSLCISHINTRQKIKFSLMCTPESFHVQQINDIFFNAQPIFKLALFLVALLN